MAGVTALLLGLAPRRAQVLHDVVHALVAHPELAAHHRGQALVEQLRRRLLQDDAARAQLQRLDRLRRIDRRRQQDRPDREAEVDQLLQRLQAVRSRHREVEQQDVGPQAGHLRDRLLAVARLADHLEPRVRLEQPAQAVSEDRVVVGDHDANGSVPLRHGASVGW